MEKIQINNQIISMRKLVKQAKVHAINKLVKEVKALKAKKGDETKIAKHQRKADRLLSEINLIKKLNVDVVSKSALSKTEDWKSIISNRSALLEERAMARLIIFDPMQKEIQQFNSKFPHLVKILPDLIQQWEEKKNHSFAGAKELKASELRKQKKEHLQKKIKLIKNAKTYEPTTKENFHDTEESLSAPVVVFASPDVKAKCKKGMEEEENVTSSSIHESLDCSKLLLDATQNSDFCDSEVNLLPEHEKENKVKGNASTKNYQKMGRHVLPNIIKNDASSNKLNKCKNSHNPKKHPVEKMGKPKKKIIVHETVSKKKKQDISSHGRGTGANNEFCSKKNRKNIHSDFANHKREVPDIQQKLISSDSDKKNNLLKATDKKSSLHPSWEAKRKLNILAKSFIPFQGKKIKFDE